MQSRATSAAAGFLLAGVAGVFVFAHAGDARDPGLPDPALTPGVIASTDESEVCGIVGGRSYSQRHRQTGEALKDWVMREYGLVSRRGYEVDHRVELSLGGGDVAANLWPQSYSGPLGAHQKDELEHAAWKMVCKEHGVPLAVAQSWFLLPDWRVVYRALEDGTLGTLGAGWVPR
jgi:hypothetical protein